MIRRFTFEEATIEELQEIRDLTLHYDFSIHYDFLLQWVHGEINVGAHYDHILEWMRKWAGRE